MSSLPWNATPEQRDRVYDFNSWFYNSKHPNFQDRLSWGGKNPPGERTTKPSGSPGTANGTGPATPSTATTSQGGYDAYNQGRARPTQNPYATSTGPTVSQSTSGQQQGGQTGPNYTTYMPQRNTPINRQSWLNSFAASALPKQDLLRWGQTQSAGRAPLEATSGPSPQDVWSRNAAIVQQINDTAARQEVGTYLGQGSPPEGWGQTSYNPQQMIGRAERMVGRGWTNPFQDQPFRASPQSPAPQDRAESVRSLLQQQRLPQEVIDQVLQAMR